MPRETDERGESLETPDLHCGLVAGLSTDQMVPVSCPGQAGHRLLVLVDEVTLLSLLQQDYHAASRVGQHSWQDISSNYLEL